MTTRNVFGTIVDAFGVPRRNIEVFFTIVPGSYVGDAGGTQVPQIRLAARTNNSGYFMRPLFVNSSGAVATQYFTEIEAVPGVADPDPFYIAVPAGATDLSLSDARTAAAPSNPDFATYAAFVDARIAVVAPSDVPVVSGTAIVADNVLPGGPEITHATTIDTLVARAGTPPVGASLILRANYVRGGSTTVIGTVAIAAGATRGATVLGAPVVLLALDLMRWDVTQIGSSTAGADIWAGVRVAA